jgi:hypothetical protein
MIVLGLCNYYLRIQVAPLASDTADLSPRRVAAYDAGSYVQQPCSLTYPCMPVAACCPPRVGQHLRGDNAPACTPLSALQSRPPTVATSSNRARSPMHASRCVLPAEGRTAPPRLQRPPPARLSPRPAISAERYPLPPGTPSSARAWEPRHPAKETSCATLCPASFARPVPLSSNRPWTDPCRAALRHWSSHARDCSRICGSYPRIARRSVFCASMYHCKMIMPSPGFAG